MSGTNGIAKYVKCNREGELSGVSIRGAWSLNGVYVQNNGSPTQLTASQILTGKIAFAPGAPNTATLPTGRDWENAIRVVFPMELGNCVNFVMGNVNAYDITVNTPGIVPGQGEMITPDGTNQVIIPAYRAVQLMICPSGSPGQYTVIRYD